MERPLRDRAGGTNGPLPEVDCRVFQPGLAKAPGYNTGQMRIERLRATLDRAAEFHCPTVSLAVECLNLSKPLCFKPKSFEHPIISAHGSADSASIPMQARVRHSHRANGK
jgi:hypothetical protein